jgi:hypothetical protein
LNIKAETDSLARVPPMASFTLRYTPPRVNIAHDCTYTARMAYEMSITPRMNHGAAFPMACSAIPPT